MFFRFMQDTARFVAVCEGRRPPRVGRAARHRLSEPGTVVMRTRMARLRIALRIHTTEMETHGA